MMALAALVHAQLALPSISIKVGTPESSLTLINYKYVSTE